MRFLPIFTAVVAAAALTFASGQAAEAAVIPNAIVDVVVTTPTPAQNSQVTTLIQWCVPNGTKEGDTFTLTLSDHLDDLPLGFSLNDPNGGAQVASAALSSTTPTVITFTMTAYAATHLNTCGTAYLKSGFDNVSTPSNVSTPFTYTTGDGRTFTTNVTPTGLIGNRDDAIKYGVWTGADQGRTNATDFLRYHISTPVGPFDSSVTTDDVPTGQPWVFDCSSLVYAQVTVDANFNWLAAAPITPTTNCTPTSLTVDWGTTAALHYDEVLVSVSLPNGPTGVSTDPVTFTNDADVTTTVGGVVSDFSAPAVNIQSSDGGNGAGTPVVTTTPTPTPTPTPTVTPTPAATPTVAPAAAGSDTLAYTGSNTAVPLSIAGGALILGLGLMLAARRRQAARAASRQE